MASFTELSQRSGEKLIHDLPPEVELAASPTDRQKLEEDDDESEVYMDPAEDDGYPRSEADSQGSVFSLGDEKVDGHEEVND